MGELVINARATALWTSSRETSRLRRPLTEFLASHGLKVAPAGKPDADNLTRAVMYFLQGGLAAYREVRDHDPLTPSRLQAFAELAFAISGSLAALVAVPDKYRTTAMIAITEILRGELSLNAAAALAFSAARQLRSVQNNRLAASSLAIAEECALAVKENQANQAGAVVELIRDRLLSA